jgi:hypothetical protein
MNESVLSLLAHCFVLRILRSHSCGTWILYAPFDVGLLRFFVAKPTKLAELVVTRARNAGGLVHSAFGHSLLVESKTLGAFVD